MNIQAQKKIEKSIPLNDHSLKIDLDLASSIEIATWNKSEVKIEVVADTPYAKYTEQFKLGVESRNGKLLIKSNSKDIVMNYQNDQGISGSQIIYPKALEHEFKYKISVPKNVILEITSITGNINSDFLHGNIKADVISGDIHIKKIEGNIELKTVNGTIEIPSQNSTVIAETQIGKITINSNLTFQKENTFIGEKVKITSDKTKNSIQVKTVNGNIILN